jgi:hypothetical protein
MPSIAFSDANTTNTTTAANLRTLRLYVPELGRLTRRDGSIGAAFVVGAR